MNDPLNPGPVRATDLLKEQESSGMPADDKRPLWKRLLASLRPSVSTDKDKRTGQKIEEFEIKGHVDF